MGETTNTRDDAPVVGEIRGSSVSSPRTSALVRTLTPVDLADTAKVEHVFDLVDLLTTIRSDEALADYVYAIAPGWDGSVECCSSVAASRPRSPARLELRVPERVG